MNRVEFRNVFFSYDGKKNVLKDVTISIPNNGLFILMGENGSGKTTLLKILIKFVEYKKGSVILEGKEINKMKLSEVSRKVAFLESEIPEIPLTVQEILSWGYFPYKEKSSVPKRLIERLNITGIYKKKFSNLSTGEKKRVLLGRIFVQKAGVVLVDEPFNFLDPRYKIEIAVMLRELSKTRAVLIATHNLNAARFLGDKIFLLKDGKITGEISCKQKDFFERISETFGISEKLKSVFYEFYRFV